MTVMGRRFKGHGQSNQILQNISYNGVTNLLAFEVM